MVCGISLMNGNGLGGGAQGAATEGRPYNGDGNREGPDGLWGARVRLW